MIRHFTSMGGYNLGESVRRMLRRLGTNMLWSLYSYKGRKGKRALSDLQISRVLIKACLSAHPKSRVLEIEETIQETLKYCPNRKGGAKYKNPDANTIATPDEATTDFDD
ncbi:uncharacterized protein LOC119733358 [Patiria miniata]|uniref:Uncharacterized protein n=1 Tax=Patiria miniata TaxID=46514 RepID=A0A914AGP4_PATMI|nr:uncharacterized protein LOC119733358 [Patiria miniata]XP_038062874.1 uncharacterized protein LOC119733358 [Patiria miniata]